MTMITPSYLGETIEYSSLHACRSTLEDPTKTGRALTCSPADWGPHVDTGRVADISQGLMDALGIQTDDEVEVIFPYSKPMT